MIFGTTHIINKTQNLKGKLMDTEIVRPTHTKYLGAIIDEKLTFNQHVDYVQPTHVVNAL